MQRVGTDSAASYPIGAHGRFEVILSVIGAPGQPHRRGELERSVHTSSFWDLMNVVMLRSDIIRDPTFCELRLPVILLGGVVTLW